MKAILLGYEIVPDYKDKEGNDKTGGAKIYLASHDFYQGFNKLEGYVPATNNYWLSNKGELFKTINQYQCPLEIDVTFTYNGRIESLKVQEFQGQ